MNLKYKNAFTVLELIVVVIIVGILASLALPRFFKMIEFSRSTEALANMSAIRQSIERCYLMHNGQISYCRGGTWPHASSHVTRWDLDIEYPGDSPNNHFAYGVCHVGTEDYRNPTGVYRIVASRNTSEGGCNNVLLGCSDEIWIQVDPRIGTIVTCGKGVFSGIGPINSCITEAYVCS